MTDTTDEKMTAPSSEDYFAVAEANGIPTIQAIKALVSMSMIPTSGKLAAQEALDNAMDNISADPTDEEAVAVTAAVATALRGSYLADCAEHGDEPGDMADNAELWQEAARDFCLSFTLFSLALKVANGVITLDEIRADAATS